MFPIKSYSGYVMILHRRGIPLISKWIGIVDNPDSKPIGFYGIDHCLVLKTGKEEETQQVCDGLLHYDDELIFVELKDRQYRGWVKTGCEQLAATVEHISRTSSFKIFVP